ncbi:unnamed protein product, partial [Ectocarpus fasciculatus]
GSLGQRQFPLAHHEPRLQPDHQEPVCSQQPHWNIEGIPASVHLLAYVNAGEQPHRQSPGKPGNLAAHATSALSRTLRQPSRGRNRVPPACHKKSSLVGNAGYAQDNRRGEKQRSPSAGSQKLGSLRARCSQGQRAADSGSSSRGGE